MPGPCPDTEALTRYLLGQLDGADLDRVRDHLPSCADCTAAVQRIQFEISVKGETPDAPGRLLADRLHGALRLPWRETVRLGKEIAQALAAAHGEGRIHRNLRPANVSLEVPTGRVTLLYFADAPQPGDLPEPSAYLAPELAHSAGDARSDLFSLGAILYEAVTGTTPYKDNTLANSAPPRPPFKLNPNMPAALSDVLLRLLARAPESRPASARDVVGLLEAIAEPPRRRRAAWLTPLAVGLVVLAGVVVVLSFLQGIEQGNRPDRVEVVEQFGEPLRKVPEDIGNRYLVIRADGEKVDEFRRIAQALANLKEGDVLEVHADGPISLGAVTLAKHGLRMRAGVGFRPRFVCADEPKVWLNLSGPVEVEGCDFVGRAADHLLDGDGAWELRGCRIIGGADKAVIRSSGQKLRCRDCLFVNSGESPLVRLAPLADFEATNCIVASNTMIEAVEGGQAITLEQCTCRTESLLLLPGDVAPEGLDPGGVMATLVGNVLCGARDGHGVRIAGWAPPWKKALHWTGERNLYVGPPALSGPDGKLLALVKEPDSGPCGREPGSKTIDGSPFVWQSLCDRRARDSVLAMQRQLDALRGRHGLPELGPPADLVPVAGQGDRRIPFVLRRGEKSLGAFDSLRPALLRAVDGDTIELHTDTYVFRDFDPPPADLLDPVRRRLTLSAGPGFRPLVDIESLPHGDSWSLVGLAFRGPETRLDWPGMSIDRSEGCEFRGGFTVTAGRSPELARCFVAGPVRAAMDPGTTFAIRQSLIGGLAIDAPGRGGRRVEIDRCVVRPSRGDAPITATDLGGVTILANDTWFDCPGPLITESRDLRAWNGIRNLYGIGPRSWSGDESLGSLTDWRRRWAGDYSSAVGEPLIHNPLEWRLAAGQAFGADVTRVAPK